MAIQLGVFGTFGVPARRRVLGACTILAAAAAIAGWFYLRNVIYFGNPLIGDWDPSINHTWWQDPGYRDASQFLRFGSSLWQPIYSTTSGLLDSIYSTLWIDGQLGGRIDGAPWRYDPMLAGVWFGIPMSMLMIVGAFQRSPGGSERFFAFGRLAVCLIFLALVARYASIPYYSAIKSTYLWGYVPWLAALAALGCRGFFAKAHSEALIFSFLACWGIISYWAYLCC